VRLRSVTPIQLMFCLIFSVLLVLLFTRFLTVREAFATVDWRLLVFLGSFMLLADELGSAGFVEWIAREMARRARGPRGLYLLVLTSSFILAMLITNDAALFAIVPFTLALARRTQLRLRRLVIYEIMAVNLGSAFTPWGNPQNLFLYHHYRLSPSGFFRESAPFALVSLAVLSLLVLGSMVLSGEKSRTSPYRETVIEPRIS